MAIFPTEATYFGLNPNIIVQQGQVPWPDFPVGSFGSIRLWGTDTTWADIEQTQGVYTFTGLDNWISMGQSHGMTNFVYTFGKGTPMFYSSDPTATICTKPGSATNTNGECYPPSDVDSGDQVFKNFVTAVVQHVQGLSGITMAWECINEPTNPEEWSGTQAQTLTMCTDLYNTVKSINSSALVTTPAPVSYDPASILPGGWMTSYLQAGGGKVADVIAFHGYFPHPEQNQPPEEINTLAQGVITAATGDGQGSKPIWDTEMGYKDQYMSDPDLQAAFVARVYLLQWAVGVSRFYWYAYGDSQIGTITTSSGTLNEAGVAYGVVDSWMVGSTLTTACSGNTTVWTCGFTTASGSQRLAVWDASQTCSAGSCTTSSYAPDSSYTQYIDLTGASHTITSGTPVQIGAKPILLEQ
jgi:hypothetical protein